MLTPAKLWLLVMDLLRTRLDGRADRDMVDTARDGLPVGHAMTCGNTDVSPGDAHTHTHTQRINVCFYETFVTVNGLDRISF